MNETQQKLTTAAVLLVFFSTLLTGLLWGYPLYKVYSSRQNGIAELAQAEFSKQVRIQEAMAKKESARFEAEAEVERSHGVAKANDIIAGSLKGNEDYLRYLYITGLQERAGEREIIYVPTEGGIPILEAGRSLQLKDK